MNSARAWQFLSASFSCRARGISLRVTIIHVHTNCMRVNGITFTVSDPEDCGNPMSVSGKDAPAADAKADAGLQMPKILGGRRFSVPNGLDFLFPKKEHKKKKPEVHWSLKTRKAERVTGNPKTWVNVLKPSEPPAPKKKSKIKMKGEVYAVEHWERNEEKA